MKFALIGVTGTAGKEIAANLKEHEGYRGPSFQRRGSRDGRGSRGGITRNRRLCRRLHVHGAG